MESSLKGKTVCCTGAAHGVGAAISMRFAKYGAKLILISSPTSRDDLHATGEKCKGEGAADVEIHTCDFRKTAEFAECCSKLEAMKIDVLVNNAGRFGPSEEANSPLEGDPQLWDEELCVNLMAPMRLTHALAPKMAAAPGGGWIINIGDVEGEHTGPRHAAYAATKHGLRGWSLGCYEALRHRGVRVTLVSAGNVDTGMQAAGKGAGGQGMIAPADVAAACMLPFQMTDNAVCAEVTLKALRAQ